MPKRKEDIGSTAVAEAPAVEIKKEVEIIESNEIFGINLEQSLQLIQKKHSDRHIAWVNQGDAKLRHNRWDPLKIVLGGSDVEVCDLKDAEKTTSNVLCWRDRKYQNMVDDDIRQKNLRSMAMQRMDATYKVAQDLTQAVGQKGIKAVPLNDGDN